MKKTLMLTLVILASLPLLAGCGVVRMVQCMNKPSLKLFNWGEYIDTSLIKAFEKEYDVCVSLSTFADNESAVTKMQTERYDVVFPSDYAIEQMVQDDMIIPLDWSKITTFDKETDIADGLKAILDVLKNGENGFDYLQYAAPYFWGNVGILYNTETVELSDLQASNWDILRNSDYRVAFYDSSRDGFMIALKQLGFSMNTTVESEILAAENWLKQMKDTMGIGLSFLTDEILDDMPALRYDLAVAYSGDAVYMMDENDKLGFYVPTNGTNVWADGMVIPKNANNVDLAYQFISFMLTYDSALDNTLEIGYSSPRKDVYEEVTGPGGDYEGYDAYSVEILENDEVYRYSSIARQLIQDAWARVRAY